MSKQATSTISAISYLVAMVRCYAMQYMREIKKVATGYNWKTMVSRINKPEVEFYSTGWS